VGVFTPADHQAFTNIFLTEIFVLLCYFAAKPDMWVDVNIPFNTHFFLLDVPWGKERQVQVLQNTVILFQLKFLSYVINNYVINY